MDTSFNDLLKIVSGPGEYKTLAALGVTNVESYDKLIRGFFNPVGGFITIGLKGEEQLEAGQVHQDSLIEMITAPGFQFSPNDIRVLCYANYNGAQRYTLPQGATNPRGLPMVRNIDNIGLIQWNRKNRKKKCSNTLVYGLLNAALDTVNTQEVSFFLNSMPNHVASNLTPYVDVEFEVRELVPTITAGGPSHRSRTKVKTGIHKFMFIDDRSGLGEYDQRLFDAQNFTLDNESTAGPSGDVRYSYMGMESFLTPATFFNQAAGTENYLVDCINPTAPVASLNGLNITVTPAGPGGGLLKHKTAKLEMMIHDRSRLDQFQELLDPSGYNNVVVWLTYGWRYKTYMPEGAENNDPYSDFINGRMMWKEAWQLITTSYSLEGTGVRVTIDLSTLNMSDFYDRELTTLGADVSIRDTTVMGKSVGQILDDLRTNIAAVKSAIDLQQDINVDSSLFKGVSDDALNLRFPGEGVDESTGAEDTGNDEGGEGDDPVMGQLDKIEKFVEDLADQTSGLSPGRSLPDKIARIRDDLERLYFPAGDDSTSKYYVAGAFRNQLRQRLGSKFKTLSELEDPFMHTTYARNVEFLLGLAVINRKPEDVVFSDNIEEAFSFKSPIDTAEQFKLLTNPDDWWVRVTDLSVDPDKTIFDLLNTAKPDFISEEKFKALTAAQILLYISALDKQIGKPTPSLTPPKSAQLQPQNLFGQGYVYTGRINQKINDAAAMFDLNPEVLKSIYYRETGYKGDNQDSFFQFSDAGAFGLGQITSSVMEDVLQHQSFLNTVIVKSGKIGVGSKEFDRYVFEWHKDTKSAEYDIRLNPAANIYLSCYALRLHLQYTVTQMVKFRALYKAKHYWQSSVISALTINSYNAGEGNVVTRQLGGQSEEQLWKMIRRFSNDKLYGNHDVSGTDPASVDALNASFYGYIEKTAYPIVKSVGYPDQFPILWNNASMDASLISFDASGAHISSTAAKAVIAPSGGVDSLNTPEWMFKSKGFPYYGDGIDPNSTLPTQAPAAQPGAAIGPPPVNIKEKTTKFSDTDSETINAKLKRWSTKSAVMGPSTGDEKKVITDFLKTLDNANESLYGQYRVVRARGPGENADLLAVITAHKDKGDKDYVHWHQGIDLWTWEGDTPITENSAASAPMLGSPLFDVERNSGYTPITQAPATPPPAPTLSGKIAHMAYRRSEWRSFKIEEIKAARDEVIKRLSERSAEMTALEKQIADVDVCIAQCLTNIEVYKKKAAEADSKLTVMGYALVIGATIAWIGAVVAEVASVGLATPVAAVLAGGGAALTAMKWEAHDDADKGIAFENENLARLKAERSKMVEVDKVNLQIGIDKLNDRKNFEDELLKELEDEITIEFPQNAFDYKYRMVSYGAIFNYFVVPVLASMNQVDEVQVVFGELNKNATCITPDGQGYVKYNTGDRSSAANINIAEFPIDIEKLYLDIQKTAFSRGSNRITIGEFIGKLNTQINSYADGIPYYDVSKHADADEDPPAPPAGSGASGAATTTGSTSSGSTSGGDDDEDDGSSRRPMGGSGKFTSVFVAPGVGVDIGIFPLKRSATVASDLLDKFEISYSVERLGTFSSNRIMRVRVSDSNNKSSPRDLIKNSIINREGTSRALTMKDFIRRLSDFGVPIETQNVAFDGGRLNPPKSMTSTVIGGDDAFNATTNTRVRQGMVQELFSDLFPTLIIGADGTLITSVSIATNSDKLDASHRMLQKTDPTKPFGSEMIPYMPTRIYPAKVSISTLGCPLFEYAQTYFVKLGSHTDLDNQYGINGITHSFTPGKFTTNIDFLVVDLYGAFRQSRTPAGLLDALEYTFGGRG